MGGEAIAHTGIIYMFIKLIVVCFPRTKSLICYVVTWYYPYKHIASSFGRSANSAGPDQTPQNAASIQALHNLLTDGSIKI